MADFCRHLLPHAGCLLTEKIANAEGMLRYRVVVEHPDGPLLGELKMKNQRLQELKPAETGPTRSMGIGSRSSKTRNEIKTTHQS